VLCVLFGWYAFLSTQSHSGTLGGGAEHVGRELHTLSPIKSFQGSGFWSTGATTVGQMVRLFIALEAMYPLVT